MREEQHQQWLEDHLTDNVEDLHNQPAGKIYLAETPWFDISATLIRERLQQGLACDDLLPHRCWRISIARFVSEKRR
jgi:nicotinate-nucleotide adenylyltransferase